VSDNVNRLAGAVVWLGQESSILSDQHRVKPMRPENL